MPHIEVFHSASHSKIQKQPQNKKFDWDYFEVDLNDSIPAEKVLPELADPVLRPAAMLRGSRYKENFTQKKLAEKLGISVRRLSEMEHAKRPIDKEMIKKLAKALNVDKRLFQ